MRLATTGNSINSLSPRRRAPDRSLGWSEAKPQVFCTEPPTARESGRQILRGNAARPTLSPASQAENLAASDLGFRASRFTPGYCLPPASQAVEQKFPNPLSNLGVSRFALHPRLLFAACFAGCRTKISKPTFSIDTTPDNRRRFRPLSAPAADAYANDPPCPPDCGQCRATHRPTRANRRAQPIAR